jgi:hypothetical protein
MMLLLPTPQTTLESLLTRHYDELRENVTRIQDLFTVEGTLDFQNHKDFSLVELSESITDASAAIGYAVQFHHQVINKEFPVAISSSNCTNVIGAMLQANESLSLLFEWHDRTAQFLNTTTHNLCSIADDCLNSLESKAAHDLFMMQLRLLLGYPSNAKAEADETHRNTICNVSRETCALLQASSFPEHREVLEALREGYNLAFAIVRLEKVEEIDLGPGSEEVVQYHLDCTDHLLIQMMRTIHDCEKDAKGLLVAKGNSRGQDTKGENRGAGL